MKDTAYYFPAPYWSLGDHSWIKSLLLFFDDIAILLPSYMYGRHTSTDPTLAGPLEERGLLHVLEPTDWIDAGITHDLCEAVVDLLTSGSFDHLPPAKHFAELSMSRIGYAADIDLAEFLVTELQNRGLAKPSRDQCCPTNGGSGWV